MHPSVKSTPLSSTLNVVIEQVERDAASRGGRGALQGRHSANQVPLRARRRQKGNGGRPGGNDS